MKVITKAVIDPKLKLQIQELIKFKGGGYNEAEVMDIIENALKLLTDVEDKGDVRVIQTALREWAYAKHWTDSMQRDHCLQPWTHYYNHQRPHGSLNYKPPISRSDDGTTS